MYSTFEGDANPFKTSFTETPQIPRKPSKPAPAETNGNGVHADSNGTSEGNATQGHKRSRSGDDGQPPKKARLGEPAPADDDVVLVEDAGGAIVIDDD